MKKTKFINLALLVAFICVGFYLLACWSNSYIYRFDSILFIALLLLILVCLVMKSIKLKTVGLVAFLVLIVYLFVVKGHYPVRVYTDVFNEVSNYGFFFLIPLALIAIISYALEEFTNIKCKCSKFLFYFSTVCLAISFLAKFAVFNGEIGKYFNYLGNNISAIVKGEIYILLVVIGLILCSGVSVAVFYISKKKGYYPIFVLLLLLAVINFLGTDKETTFNEVVKLDQFNSVVVGVMCIGLLAILLAILFDYVPMITYKQEPYPSTYQHEYENEDYKKTKEARTKVVVTKVADKIFDEIEFASGEDVSNWVEYEVKQPIDNSLDTQDEERNIVLQMTSKDDEVNSPFEEKIRSLPSNVEVWYSSWKKKVLEIPNMSSVCSDSETFVINNVSPAKAVLSQNALTIYFNVENLRAIDTLEYTCKRTTNEKYPLKIELKSLLHYNNALKLISKLLINKLPVK